MDNPSIMTITGIVRGRSIELLEDVGLKDNTKVEIEVKRIDEITTDDVYGIVKPVIDPLMLEDAVQDDVK